MTELLDGFRDYILNTHKSPEKTAQNTIPDVREFLSIMEIDSINKLSALKVSDIQKYLTALRTRNLQDGTRKVKVARVRMFFNYLMQMEYITKNIMFGQKVVAADAEVTRFSHSDVVKILNQAKNITEHAILHTLMGTGMRIDELVSLTCDKVLNDSRVQVLGKGKKWRTIECPSEVTRVLFDYIEKTKTIRGKSPYVFITRTGNKMDRSNISDELKDMAKRAKVDNWEQFSPHKVRHMYGDYCLNDLHIPIDVISKNLGHADVAITSRIYAKTNKERIREYVDEINNKTFFGRKEHNFDDK